MIKPTLSQAKLFAKTHNVVPVAMEMFADVKTSMQILRNLNAKSKNFFMLESAKSSDTWGRYTFLGYDPQLTVRSKRGTVEICRGLKTETRQENPLTVLRAILQEYKSPKIADLPPFTGGFVGYLSYDCIEYFEPSLKLQAIDPEGFYDFELMLIDKVIAIDHFSQKIYLIVN